MAQNMCLEAKIKSLEDSEQNLQFHSFFPFSSFLGGGVEKKSWTNHASQDGHIGNIVTLFLKHARDHRFLGMGNHLEPF